MSIQYNGAIMKHFREDYKEKSRTLQFSWRLLVVNYWKYWRQWSDSPSSTLYGVEVRAEYYVEWQGVLEDIRVSITAKGAESRTVQEG